MTTVSDRTPQRAPSSIKPWLKRCGLKYEIKSHHQAKRQNLASLNNRIHYIQGFTLAKTIRGISIGCLKITCDFTAEALCSFSHLVIKKSAIVGAEVIPAIEYKVVVGWQGEAYAATIATHLLVAGALQN